MAKIDLTSAPYFDDYSEKQRFYKLLFRPGRAVQARELTQLQTVIQKQVSRLGTHFFDKNALVYPKKSLGCKYDTSTFFINVEPDINSHTSSEADIKNYWLNKKIVVEQDGTNPGGVKGVVIGYHIIGGNVAGTTTLPSAVRLFVALSDATAERKTFVKNDKISVDVLGTNGILINKIFGRVKNAANSVGRIASVEIPESIYFYNDYFVLVDGQYFFITPDAPEDAAAWGATPSCEVGIQMNESVVTFEDDSTLLDNANGSSNFSAPGADRLRVEGALTKKGINSTDQNFIKLLTIVDGIITKGHQLEVDPYSDTFSSHLATRTKEESGDYTLNPFIARTKELIGAKNEGLYTEDELSFSYNPDDEATYIAAKKNAGEFSKDFFNVPLDNKGLPTVFDDTTNKKFYPGTSYVGNESTSFKNLCADRIGIEIEPGVAYVQGYRQEIFSKRKVAIERSRTSSLISNAIIQTPLGTFAYVNNLYGCPPVSDGAGGTGSYGKVDLYSSVIQFSSGVPSTPASSDKIGSARVYGLEFFSGALGSLSAVFKLGLFDVTFNDGKSFSDLRSLYTSSGSGTGTFFANLSLVDVSVTPKLQFEGFINYLEPFSTTTSTHSYVYTTSPAALKITRAGSGSSAGTDALNGNDFGVGTAVEVSYTESTSSSTTRSTVKLITNRSYTATTSSTSGATTTYTYENVLLNLDSSITPSAQGDVITITGVKTVYKVKGTGTSWKSKPGESLKRGDQVAIGSGSNTRIYTVFSDPANDNELNLTPDPTASNAAPWKSEGSSIMKYLQSEPLQETDIGNVGLLFRLPHTSIRTIRGGDKNSPNYTQYSLTYTSRRFVQVDNVTSNSVALPQAATNEKYAAGTSGYLAIDSNGKYYNVVTGNSAPGNTNNVTLNWNSSNPTFIFPSGAPAGGNYRFFVPIEKTLGANASTSAAVEGTKTLLSGSKIITDGKTTKISLGQADVFRITRVTASPNIDATPNVTTDPDIKGAYTFDNGQRDYYYGIAELNLRNGGSKPTGQVRVDFEYFNHSGDYFTVDSYPWRQKGTDVPTISYDEIPFHDSPKYGRISLKSCVDFRPKATGSSGDVVAFERYKEFPLQSISATYHVYESRKDKLYIDTQGDIKIKYGAPGLISTQPSEPADGMTLYNIDMLPYTATHTSCTLLMKDNRRYTMRDIGKLDNRIKSLEYYTSLSLLESDTKELVIKDALGQDKFKHGFLTDNFENPSVSDLYDPDYSASIDTDARELKPTPVEDHISLIEHIPSSAISTLVHRESKNYQLTNTIFTLPYKNTSYLEQPLCSRVINVNPYNTQSWIGGVTITPWTDTWRETEVGEPLLVRDDSAYQTAAKGFDKNGESVLWLGTRQEWTGIDIETHERKDVVNQAGHSWPAKRGQYKDKNGNLIHGTGRPENGDMVMVPFGQGFKNEGQMVPYGRKGSTDVYLETDIKMTGRSYEEGIKSTLVDGGYSNPISMGTRIKDVKSATYIRTNSIRYEGKGFLPNSKLYAFFDDQNVTAYCHPDAGNGEREESATNVFRGPYQSAAKLKIGFEESAVFFQDSGVSGQETILFTADGTTGPLADVTYNSVYTTNPTDNAILTGTVTYALEGSSYVLSGSPTKAITTTPTSYTYAYTDTVAGQNATLTITRKAPTTQPGTDTLASTTFNVGADIEIKYNVGATSYTEVKAITNRSYTATTSAAPYTYETLTLKLNSALAVAPENTSISEVSVLTGTKFLQEVNVGSTIALADGTELQIKSISSNTKATIQNPPVGKLSNTNAQKALDKSEYLMRLYSGKFVDIKNSSYPSRNVLDARITNVSYNPLMTSTDSNNTNLSAKLKFDFTGGSSGASGLSMTPTTGTPESSSTLSLVIKNATSSTAPGTSSFLLCDSTGSVRGNFVIPDPKVASNPKFRTGDRAFRLTNSEKNENTNEVSRAESKYSATGWVDVTEETLYSTKQFTVNQQSVQQNAKALSLEDSYRMFSRVCPMDPLAQSFTVTEKEGIYITAVDIFVYSKDTQLPLRFQIRPLDDGGNPSINVMFERLIDSADVVVNKFDLSKQQMKIIGATGANAKPGFNAPPWNISTPTTTELGDPYKVYTKNFLDGAASWTNTGDQNSGNWFNYTKVNNVPNPSGDMIPTRVVFDYPIYLPGDNRNYCFVLLTDSVQGEGTAIDALENTYQVYMAQTGIADAGPNESATPIHLLKPLEKGEDDINFILGTTTRLQNVPKATGMLFKSINGISWESDQRADLKFQIHKAAFDNTVSGEVEFCNPDTVERRLNLDPIQTKAGSNRIRVSHRNHNIPNGDYVVLSGISSSADLNGIPYHVLCNIPHMISSPTLDTYVIELESKYEANESGFVGGANVVASNNIRFEEFYMMANPLVLPDTEITWRAKATTAQTAYDPNSQPWNSIPTFSFTPNVDVKMPLSGQIYSKVSETKKLSGKSLVIYATLKSKSPNISPSINSDRIALTTKSVRLNNPYGTGQYNNINDTFDEYVCLPTNVTPAVTSSSLTNNVLFFSETKNTLTGGSFLSTGNKVTAVGALFTTELSVGDTIRHPNNQSTAKVIEIIDNNTLLTDRDIGIASGEGVLSRNPPPLKIKTSHVDVATHLSKLDVGKYVSISGTTSGFRDTTISSQNTLGVYRRIISVKYTPNATGTDPDLSAPCLCEVAIEHYLPQTVSKGFESSATTKITQLDNFIDEISPIGGSVSSKYICKTMKINKSANCLKVMFDGCRPRNAEIELYYRTGSQADSAPLSTKNWTKLEYSLENNGVLEYVQPDINSNHSSFSAYEANALQISPFSMAQVKIVFKGGESILYPKIKNLRILALEE